MQIKCYLFAEQFFSPIKTASLDLPSGLSDAEIMELAKIELFKDFRIEIEDVREIKGKRHKVQLPNRPAPTAPAPSKRRPSIFWHNDIRYKKADIMKLHGLSSSQYRYLINIKKYSHAEIIEKGMALYKQPRPS